MTLPNLKGIATQELVEQIGGSGFKASYINWSRTMQLLRDHAPGWLPHTILTNDGDIVHKAPVGGYLLIQFYNMLNEARSPPMPQAIMDSRNNAIPYDKITARDITDTHRRGICMAAAMTFGLAYELWAKMPLESGYHEPDKAQEMADANISPSSGVLESLEPAEQERAQKMAEIATEYHESGDPEGAYDYITRSLLPDDGIDMKVAVNSLLPAELRRKLKKINQERSAK